MEVGQVAADQAQAEEETNGYNGAQVDAASHLNGLPAIKQGGVPRQKLGHHRRKREMERGQEHRVGYGVLAKMLCFFSRLFVTASIRVELCLLTEAKRRKNPFVEQNDGGAQGDPDAAMKALATIDFHSSGLVSSR